jgi:hypothetical protein
MHLICGQWIAAAYDHGQMGWYNGEAESEIEREEEGLPAFSSCRLCQSLPAI